MQFLSLVLRPWHVLSTVNGKGESNWAQSETKVVAVGKKAHFGMKLVKKSDLQSFPSSSYTCQKRIMLYKKFSKLHSNILDWFIIDLERFLGF